MNYEFRIVANIKWFAFEQLEICFSVILSEAKNLGVAALNLSPR